MTNLNVDSFENIVPVSHMRGEDDEETRVFHEMLLEAKQYYFQRNNERIANEYFGGGIGGVFAIFLFENAVKKTWNWVIVGDLPSVCLDAKANDSPISALERYCAAMKDWVDKVVNNKTLKNSYPVLAEPTIQNAELLSKRILFIKKKIIPWLED